PFNGITYTSSITGVTDTLQTVGGCDSIVSLDLTVLPPALPTVVDVSGCGFVVFEGKTYIKDLHFNDTVISSYGCDSLYRTIHITVYPNNPVYRTYDTIACRAFVLNGQVYLQDTVVQDTLFNVHGCDSVVRTFKVSIEHFELSLTSDWNDPYRGEYIRLTTASDIYYEIHTWSPAESFPHQREKIQNLRLYQPATVTVIAYTLAGCWDTASLAFTVADINHTVSIPNAFTPNGDGRNDVFRPLLPMKRAYTIKYFRIYNRWGQEVYHINGELT